MVTTFTRRHVLPLDLKPEDIALTDIAHSLACVNRFGGHARRPISVAQHSIAVSLLCDPGCALQGLLHDASEAYLGDVTKWLKATPAFEAYRAAEDRATRAIFQKFNVQAALDESVEAADKLAVRWEYEQSYGARIGLPGYPDITDDEASRIVRLCGPFGSWPWEEAKEKFLDRFVELVSQTSKWDRSRGLHERVLQRFLLVCEAQLIQTEKTAYHDKYSASMIGTIRGCADARELRNEPDGVMAAPQVNRSAFFEVKTKPKGDREVHNRYHVPAHQHLSNLKKDMTVIYVVAFESDPDPVATMCAYRLTVETGQPLYMNIPPAQRDFPSSEELITATHRVWPGLDVQYNNTNGTNTPHFQMSRARLIRYGWLAPEAMERFAQGRSLDRHTESQPRAAGVANLW